MYEVLKYESNPSSYIEVAMNLRNSYNLLNKTAKCFQQPCEGQMVKVISIMTWMRR